MKYILSYLMSRIVKYLLLPRGRKIYTFCADWVTLERST